MNKEENMKVSVDRELCMGDRNCNIICPEVFKYQEDELMSVVQFDEIPEKYKGCSRKAAEECAAHAITVGE
jgi:ferredoxin